jgi:hypothetical protein
MIRVPLPDKFWCWDIDIKSAPCFHDCVLAKFPSEYAKPILKELLGENFEVDEPFDEPYLYLKTEEEAVLFRLTY